MSAPTAVHVGCGHWCGSNLCASSCGVSSCVMCFPEPVWSEEPGSWSSLWETYREAGKRGPR